MKILFYIGSLEKGGAERVMSNLANSFAGENEIVLITNVNRIEYPLNKNIKYYYLYDEKKTSIIQQLKKLKDIIEKERPDVIMSFLTGANFRILLLKKQINIPIIISVRNNPKIEYKSIKNKVLMKLLYSRADGIVFQTEEAKKYFSKNIQKKSIIIPNPIKKEFIDRDLYKEEKEKIIVTVGRLERQKNHKLLIDSFYDIKDKIPEYKLIIYGEGSLRKELEEKIIKLEMEDRIFLPGVVDDIAKAIEKARIFVLSSDYEGMPNALMEAMALGLVVISTDCPCGGPKFLIGDNERGYLVKVNDKQNLKKMIEKILIHTKKEDLEKISNKAKNFTLTLSEERISNVWYEYIKDVGNKIKV